VAGKEHIAHATATDTSKQQVGPKQTGQAFVSKHDVTSVWRWTDDVTCFDAHALASRSHVDIVAAVATLMA
jgi:hypothetical protein